MPNKKEYLKVDDSIIDNGDARTIMDPVWCNVSIYDGEKKYNEGLAAFSTEQRYLLAIIWYFEEVNNGGHEQFYDNSTGIVWKDAFMGFKELNIKEFADIIEESAKRLGGKPSLERESRQKELERIKPNYDDLDDRLYKIEQQIDIDEEMKKYILNHRASFYFEGEVTKWEPK